MIFKFYGERYEYRPRLFSSLASFFALLILLSLSAWQIYRLQWKTNLINQRINAYESQSKEIAELPNPEDYEFQRVFMKGKPLNDYEMFMPALSKNGNNGYHIIVPLRLENGKNIISIFF